MTVETPPTPDLAAPRGPVLGDRPPPKQDPVGTAVLAALTIAEIIHDGMDVHINNSGVTFTAGTVTTATRVRFLDALADRGYSGTVRPFGSGAQKVLVRPIRRGTRP